MKSNIFVMADNKLNIKLYEEYKYIVLDTQYAYDLLSIKYDYEDYSREEFDIIGRLHKYNIVSIQGKFVEKYCDEYEDEETGNIFTEKKIYMKDDYDIVKQKIQSKNCIIVKNCNIFNAIELLRKMRVIVNTAKYEDRMLSNGEKITDILLYDDIIHIT